MNWFSVHVLWCWYDISNITSDSTSIWGMSDGGQDSYLAWISECCYDAFIAVFIDDCCWEISMAVTKSVDSPPACLQFLYHLGQDS